MSKKIDYNNIISRNQKLISEAINIMLKIKDFEHDINHIEDVIKYVKELVENIEDDFDVEVCVIAAYWHDVGRIVKINGHEKISANMLYEQMKILLYDEKIIERCVNAIKYHKWNMCPKTIEGKILRDADKLAWLGIKRWKNCLKHKKNLDDIINLLPKLRDEILYFDYSRCIYDKEVVKLVNFLYNNMYSKMR